MFACFQSKVAELSDVSDELATSKKERSSLQAKIVQLTTALKSALATKVSFLDCSEVLCCRLITLSNALACGNGFCKDDDFC